MKTLLSFKSKWAPFLSICSTLTFLLITDNLVAQVRPWMPPAALEIAAKGTGRTTGHIVTLLAVNNSDQPQQLEVGNFLIPSNGRDQSYVVPALQNIEVPPGATISVDLIGYCADITRPPVGPNEPMPAPNTWLIPVNTINPDGPPGFIVLPDAVSIVERKPGQTYIDNVPVGYISTTPDQAIIVDPDKNPEQAATFLLDAINRISFIYDELQPEGIIKTPFSSNQARERESVIQQTFWMYGAALSGDTYEKEQFAEQLAEQYENSTGNPIASAPPAEKAKFDAGVDDFWNSFTVVGVEAKILKPNGLLSDPLPSKPKTTAGSLSRNEKETEPKTPPKDIQKIQHDIVLLRNKRTQARLAKERHQLDEKIKELEKEIEEIKNPSDKNDSKRTASNATPGVANLASGGSKNDNTKKEDEIPSTTKEPEPEPESEPELEPESEPEPERCECTNLNLRVRIKKPDGSYDRYFDIDYEYAERSRVINEIDASSSDLAVGEEIEIELSDINFGCTCEQTSPCDTYPPRRQSTRDIHPNAQKGGFRIYTSEGTFATVKNNPENTKITVKARYSAEECKEKKINRFYSLIIEQVCKTQTCLPKLCHVQILIQL